MVTHNLPHHPIPFVGRESEIANLHRLLDQSDCRLVTIVGPGGMGKTRLAVEAVKRYLVSESGRAKTFTNGIFFIPFQPLSASDYMVSTIADNIGCHFYQEHDLQQQLLNHLHKKSMLLIMDNLEHLTEGLKLLSDILSTAPNVAIIATSRERLNLQEEWILDIDGLTFPKDETAFDIKPYSATKLFVLHARRVHERFSMNESRQRDVIRICRLVEGMPLAIELAAAWIRVLPCEKIATEIESSLDILTSSARNVIPRHQNIRATLDPTWNRLTEVEQSVFKKLSVFRGGFNRHAAESVAGATLSTLSALVDKSLLRADPNGRFDMHELLRQYAEEQLMKDVMEGQQVHGAYSIYFTEFMKSREHDLSSGRQHETIREMEIELDNIRAAWGWAIEQVIFPALRAGAHTYHMFFDIQGRYQEARDALSLASKRVALIKPAEERDYTLAVVNNSLGASLIRLGEFDEAQTVLKTSFQLYKKLGKPAPPGIGTEPSAELALLATTTGKYEEALVYGDEALRRIDTDHDKLNVTYTHYALASAKYSLGQFDSAFEHAQQAYQISSKLGDRWFGAYILMVMGNIALAQEDYDRARAYYQSSYDDKKLFDDLGGMGLALNSMARIAWQQGNFQDAARLYRQGYELYREINDPGGLATSIFGLGDTAQAQGDYIEGMQFFRQAFKITVEINWSPLILQIFTGIGELLLKNYKPERAVELLTFTVQSPASEPPTRRRAEQLLDRLRRVLPSDTFNVAQQRGERQDIDELVAAVLEELEQAQDDLPQHQHGSMHQELVEPLTPREYEVLRLMANGMTNPQIAEQLTIATGTVKTYTNRIFGKLGVTNRVEAVNRARELHLF